MDEAVIQRLNSAKVLMVGAGGIGCELLKNLVLSEFGSIDVVDLDTIDVSNLNRQFLFSRQHVGRSKAEVAVESVQAFNICSKIRYFHASIQDHSFDVHFFKQYDLVLNALDNKAARSHVNRLCLAADVPLMESGSAGYLGQVRFIKKGMTECYDCQPKPAPRTFPGCTIRNTPSEPIHCVVWAKHLFNQLFAVADPDEDVSPDVSDPDIQDGDDEQHPNTNGGVMSNSTDHTSNNNNNNTNHNEDEEVSGILRRVSTRKWAAENSYNPKMLLLKFFDDDINYLLSMGNLWKKRRPPSPLNWDSESDAPEAVTSNSFDQAIWSVSKCRTIFADCVNQLKSRLAGATETELVWDKDDDVCMNFVTACSNLRAHCFHIQKKSRFEIKSMAGNIIPAIATTNAVIAGLVVVEAVKILTNRVNECVATFLTANAQRSGKLLSTSVLDPPNPLCYVCSSKPEVAVKLNCSVFTVQSLAEKVLKQRLNMVAPDVETDDNTGRIIISSEEGETTELMKKTLSELNVNDDSRLKCDDFLQQYELRLIICHSNDFLHDGDFEVLTDTSSLKAEPMPGPSAAAAAAEVSAEDDDDDLAIIDDDAPPADPGIRKRKAEEIYSAEELTGTSKRSK